MVMTTVSVPQMERRHRAVNFFWKIFKQKAVDYQEHLYYCKKTRNVDAIIAVEGRPAYWW